MSLSEKRRLPSRNREMNESLLYRVPAAHDAFP